MLEKIDLNKTVDKQLYKQELKALEARLSSLQGAIGDLGIPVILAFEGWSASGKGTLISRVVYPLDPRYFNVYTMDKVTEDALMRPFLWSFWIRTPSKGRISVFDKSWNRLILPGAAERWKLGASVKKGYFYDVNSFEKQLIDDGALIVKFFLHISKDEQKKRFKEIEKNPSTAWRVTEHDWAQNKDYDGYLKDLSEMISQTNFNWSPWNIIESNDAKYATLKIYKILIARVEEEIMRRAEVTPPIDFGADTPATRTRSKKSGIDTPKVNILSGVNPARTISDKEYKEKLGELQDRIAEQGYKMYTKRRSVIILYEGWDAAGKGGNIKRLTERLDPRAYEVAPIAAPSKEELDHHYLWRFYNKMPKDGHLAIFDRSWYGRVMVERIEELTPEDVWRRAYKEINDMELHLANHGTVIFKFWLHIDQEEQLARFQSRQNDPLKQYKITEEDWRNREKWDKYVTAVDEMLLLTNTRYAPWTIVESNCKKFARIKTLEIVTNELDRQLR
ncbi:MAG: polyphosphate:AMP phosphotransferase [Clostridiales bacterium]|jgi:polyphosphate:AMP phosphotransferase|nr:polyphosphate:AMP phosphotransferase [Clostridiales bacterium]